jgi:hypothetical protein
MPFVEGSHAAAPLQSGRRHNYIVETNHFAGRFQLCPDAGVFISRLFRVGSDEGKPGDVHHVYLRSARTVGIQFASVQIPFNQVWRSIAFEPAQPRPGY